MFSFWQTLMVFLSYASTHFPPISPWLRNNPELLSREATLCASVLIWYKNFVIINVSENYTDDLMTKYVKRTKFQTKTRWIGAKVIRADIISSSVCSQIGESITKISCHDMHTSIHTHIWTYTAYRNTDRYRRVWWLAWRVMWGADDARAETKDLGRDIRLVNRPAIMLIGAAFNILISRFAFFLSFSPSPTIPSLSVSLKVSWATRGLAAVNVRKEISM